MKVESFFLVAPMTCMLWATEFDMLWRCSGEVGDDNTAAYAAVCFERMLQREQDWAAGSPSARRFRGRVMRNAEPKQMKSAIDGAWNLRSQAASPLRFQKQP